MSFSHYDKDGAQTSHLMHCCIGARRATHCATGDDNNSTIPETKVKFTTKFFLCVVTLSKWIAILINKTADFVEMDTTGKFD